MSLKHFGVFYQKAIKGLHFVKFPLFVIYLFSLFYIVFFARRRSGLVLSKKMINIIPIKNTYIYLFKLRSHYNFEWFLVSNLLGNILLFIPLPFFLKALFNITKPAYLVMIGAALSFSIEFLQLIFKIGIPDIDDLILNVIGLGIGIFLLSKLDRCPKKFV